MGIPAQFQHPDFLAALRTVIAAGKKHGCRLGIQPGNMEQCEQWLGLGFDVISWSVDSAIYRQALVSAVAALRNR